MSMTSQTDDARTLRMRGDYVLLRADGLRLLLPQRDVVATEYREQAPRPGTQAGLFMLPQGLGGDQDVVALSQDLTRLEHFPEDRHLLTRLAAAGRRLALAWSEVRVLIDTELEFHALAAILRSAEGVIDAYVEIDDEPAFCTTAQRMLAQVLQPAA
jgi:hypothetical protein